MIKNERQYRITLTQAKKFERAVERVKSREAGVHPLLRKAQTEGIQSQLDDLREELKQYETVKSGAQRRFVFENLDEMLSGLTQARIARGLTQKQLGEKLRIKEQQVQRYEATDYAAANASRLSEVMNALDIKVRGTSIIEKGRSSSKRKLRPRERTAHGRNRSKVSEHKQKVLT
jgi:ribosome-binding protein aMBF1 (putative translation factor)